MSDRGTGRPSRSGSFLRGIVAASLLAVAAGPAAAPVAAVTGLELSTPFPAVVVEPGGTASFDLRIEVTQARRVNLAVGGVPTGWEARLRGGGLVIDGAFVQPDEPPNIRLDVSVPDDAAAGTRSLTVTATSGSLTETLRLDLRVQVAAAGSVSLESDFPELRGPSDATYTFNLTLRNDTPGESTFALAATAPQGWNVTAVPAGQTQATSISVAGGSTGRVTVTVRPGETVAADTYPIVVQAIGGGRTAEVQLRVVVTGTYRLAVTTADDVLSATANAGAPTELSIVIQNTGTAPLAGVDLTATAPTNWTVTFDPETVGEIAPRASATVTATVTPANAAIAGDYQVTIRATTDETSGSAAIRMRVETPQFWWIVGIGLILLTFGGLYWVFRTYGRR